MRFTLDAGDLWFIGRENRPVIEPGQFIVKVADIAEEFVLE